MRKKQVISDLKEALESAKMESASFDVFETQPTVIQPGEITAFIKERTRPFHQSWIIARIERALVEIEK